MGKGWRMRMLADGFTADLESIEQALANAIEPRESSADDNVKLRIHSFSGLGGRCEPTGTGNGARTQLLRRLVNVEQRILGSRSSCSRGAVMKQLAALASCLCSPPEGQRSITMCTSECWRMLRLCVAVAVACPLGHAYTAPYLRIMKILYASSDDLHVGWGACDGGETVCELARGGVHTAGAARALECANLSQPQPHPAVENLSWDVCYEGPGSYR